MSWKLSQSLIWDTATLMTGTTSTLVPELSTRWQRAPSGRGCELAKSAQRDGIAEKEHFWNRHVESPRDASRAQPQAPPNCSSYVDGSPSGRAEVVYLKRNVRYCGN